MEEIGDAPIIQSGRAVTDAEIEQIKETVALFRHLSHRELSDTICEHMRWYTASGSNKTFSCMKLLERLESLGIIRLPEKRKINGQGRYRRSVEITAPIEPQADIIGTVKDLGKIELEVIEGEEREALWNEYMSRYHYLGSKKAIGFHIRYFIRYSGGLLGSLLFCGAAKSIGVRERWIGWSENQRLRNLAWVINNWRLLIFPWVKVKNFSSHVLGQINRRIGRDWEKRWGYSPVLMETFVDPALYEGTSYKAGGWTYLGMTTGEGLVRRGKSYTTTPKMVYVRPLRRDFRELLCLERLVGREQL